MSFFSLFWFSVMVFVVEDCVLVKCCVGVSLEWLSVLEMMVVCVVVVRFWVSIDG